MTKSKAVAWCLTIAALSAVCATFFTEDPWHKLLLLTTAVLEVLARSPLMAPFRYF